MSRHRRLFPRTFEVVLIALLPLASASPSSAEKHSFQVIVHADNPATALSIADVSDKKNPVPLSSATYPNVSYVHQAWIDDEHRYLYMGDEGDEFGGDLEGTRTLVWDVTDLDDPIMVKEYIAETQSTDHNLYIKGNYAYQSNYVSGLRVLDISDRENPVLVGFFDTEPFGEDEPGFNGSWSNYPFFASGVIVVTSMKEGVFLLKKKETLVP